MPGFFGDQSERLLRTKWRDKVDPFAIELWSMFASDAPMTSTVPVAVDLGENPTGEPAITVTNGPIQIVMTDPNVPGIRLIDDTPNGHPAPVTVGSSGGGGDKPLKLPPDPNLTPPGDVSSPDAGATATMIGRVLSGFGNGPYQVADLGGTGNYSVFQASIAGSDVVPAGTMAMFCKGHDGVYRMQVPVWL